uniref:Uncharacterized protein n=1 Tax=Pyxicephalus adspersus TaxID=30357 RepID=A0AAV3A5Q7_PYXAD|nr:TPA: hypothetical protein GDO54_016876 [Pyxicephalus adspersus]
MSVVVRVACSGGQLMRRHVMCMYKIRKERKTLATQFPCNVTRRITLYAIPTEFLYICLNFILSAIQYTVDRKATFNGIPVLQLCSYMIEAL